MPYRITNKDRSVQETVRRIASEQLGRAVEEMGDLERDQASRVHQGRKRIKKVRALIKFVRPAFDDFSQENIALRDAGRLLAPYRDAQSVTVTFDRLGEAAKEDDAAPDARALANLRKRLVAPSKTTDDAGEALVECAARLIEIAQRALRWKLRPKGPRAFEKGLARSRRKWKTAMRNARHTLRRGHDGESADALHEWRKHVKAHAQQLRILAPVWSEVVGAEATEARALAEMLGEHHDLHLLMEALSDDTLGHDDIRKALTERAARRSQEIVMTALAAGARFTAEKPGDAAQRLARLYKTWRRGIRKEPDASPSFDAGHAGGSVDGWFGAQPRPGS